MTTSPKVGTPQPGPPAGGSPAASVGPAALLEKRASSIGWYFIELYYGFFNDGIENIHKLYHPQASVSHLSFPAEGSEKVLHQAVGIDAIRKRFSKVEPAVNRIVISSADIQVCLQDKILIVVYGEWSRDNGPFWQFSQTFLLCPGKRETILDLANDVLRFVDYNLFSGIKEEEKTDKSENAEKAERVEKADRVEKAEKAEKAEKVEKAEKPAEKDKPSATDSGEKSTEPSKSEPEASEIALEQADSVPSGSGNAETAPSSVEPEASQPRSDSGKGGANSDADHSAETEQAAAPEEKGPLTWAALAATAKETRAQAAKPAPRKVSTPSAVSSPPASGSAASVAGSGVLSGNGKYKKEDWFPIYIRGVKDVEENSLRDHLTKSFGPIKFLKSNMNIALCDFQDAESQRRALNAKETIVDGIAILLEVRELKANVKAFKAQKEKTDFKKKVDKKAPKKKGRD